MTCSIEGCDKPVLARGWCGMHYRRWHTHGDPLATRLHYGEPVKRFQRFVPGGLPLDACWEWEGARTSRGYGSFSISRRFVSAHRFAYVQAHGPISPGEIVRHSCDNPPCVNPAHLLVGTHSDNANDKFLRDRHPVHRLGTASKVDQDRVREVRRRAAAGDKQCDIAADVGLSRSYVCNILSGKACWWVK